MQKRFVLTLTGPDRIGFVGTVTRLLLDRGGNVETSRMARLGGEFAILMLVSMPAESRTLLERDFEALTSDGYKLTLAAADPPEVGAHAGWLPRRIEVQGADHEGIIHDVAQFLSEQGINIESVDSETTPAPITGVPLFSMIARVVVPPDLSGEAWTTALAEIGEARNLEIRVQPLETRSAAR
jgi:glycine cleavage system transcriptional repressor